MISKLASVAALAIATTFSSASLAIPISVDINVAPPPPRFEVVPAARPGYLWAPGYWDWRHGRHYWVAGTWARQRPGYIYSQPAWEQRNGRWHFNRGNWARGPGGDRDHDGVPNRLDRHPDNPNRR
jgi:hypothetical protein